MTKYIVDIKGDLISREALKEAIKNSFKHNLNGYDALLISEIDEFIDNAPTVAVLKDERPKACFNCEHCCALELKNNGEILIKCNLGNGQKCGEDMRKENNI